MLKNLIQEFINIEIKFIVLIQYLFNGPEENLLLIKLGKFFTNNHLHNEIIKYTVIYDCFRKYYYGMTISSIIQFLFFNIIKIHLVLYISKSINYTIKHTFKIPRPYLKESNIQKITIKKDKSKSYSFPSNSIQNSYVFYWNIFNTLHPDSLIGFWIINFIILLLAFIKTLRGLHYLHDIIPGLIIANLIVYPIKYYSL